MALNKHMIIGNLGQNPELKYTPAGLAVTSFNIATNESWTDKAGQKQERTTWHRIVVWGKLAENCAQYLAKGRQVYIEGPVHERDWQDKDGQKRTSREITAQVVQFLGQGGQGGNRPPHPADGAAPAGAAPAGTPTGTPAGGFTEDDIPF